MDSELEEDIRIHQGEELEVRGLHRIQETPVHYTREDHQLLGTQEGEEATMEEVEE
jgi:hypothetical protein